jgi:hypothetical protein
MSQLFGASVGSVWGNSFACCVAGLASIVHQEQGRCSAHFSRPGENLGIRKSLWIILPALFAAIGAPTVVRANSITYNINQTVGIGSIAGTITTDGTIGTLATANIVGWSLTLNDGTTTIGLIPSDSITAIIGSDLTASVTDLTFNFSGGDYGQLVFADTSVGSGYGVVCFEDPNQNCGGVYNRVVLYNLGLDGLAPNIGLFGNQVIATVATPEPGTVGLVLIGIGLMLVMRKRIAQSLPQAT